MTDSLRPEVVRPLLLGRFGREYRYRESCESTQLLLDADLEEGAVALCEEQTRGRGRLGRGWEATAGTALLFSVLLRPPSGRRTAELSLVAGVAVAEALEAAIGTPVGVKWPNDVLVEGRKVAGILAEVRGDFVALGTGVNVNQVSAELPAGPRRPAASLLSVDGVRRERAPLLAGLLARLELRYESWVAHGLGRLLPGLEARDYLRGRKVTVADLRGYAVGFDALGRLQVEAGGTRHAVDSGEVDYEA